MQALELQTVADDNGALKIQLSQQFKNRKFKVILLALDDEEEWLSSLQKNPSFGFLNDEGEDIYTLKDGKPLHD